jgi:hypothetical protein
MLTKLFCQLLLLNITTIEQARIHVSGDGAIFTYMLI